MKVRARNRESGQGPLLLHVFPSFAAGGAQMRFIALANHFGSSFRHRVIALDGDLAARDRLAPDLTLSFLDVSVEGGVLRRLARYREALADLRPDALVTSNWGTIEWAIVNVFPLARHVHTEDGFGVEERDRQLPRRVWARRLALRRSRVVVPSSKLLAIAREEWRLPRAHVRYVPNGVDLTRFFPGPPRPEPPGEPVIGCVAALRSEKNLARLLHAAHRLAATMRFRLVIVGEGPERPALVALARSLGLAAEFRGEISDPAPLYRGFDIFALSSDTEQMPLSVLEAMASGLPIVSTDVGDVGMMVAAANKPVVSGRDDEALARSLAALLTAPELRREIGAANRMRAEREYDALVMYERYRQIYAGVEEGGRR